MGGALVTTVCACHVANGHYKSPPGTPIHRPSFLWRLQRRPDITSEMYQYMKNSDICTLLRCSQAELTRLKSEFRLQMQQRLVNGRPLYGQLLSTADAEGVIQTEMWQSIAEGDPTFRSMLSGSRWSADKPADFETKLRAAKKKIAIDLNAMRRRTRLHDASLSRQAEAQESESLVEVSVDDWRPRKKRRRGSSTEPGSIQQPEARLGSSPVPPSSESSNVFEKTSPERINYESDSSSAISHDPHLTPRLTHNREASSVADPDTVGDVEMRSESQECAQRMTPLTQMNLHRLSSSCDIHQEPPTVISSDRAAPGGVQSVYARPRRSQSRPAEPSTLGAKIRQMIDERVAEAEARIMAHIGQRLDQLPQTEILMADIKGNVMAELARGLI